jgi:hypothetical protein
MRGKERFSVPGRSLDSDRGAFSAGNAPAMKPENKKIEPLGT